MQGEKKITEGKKNIKFFVKNLERINLDQKKRVEIEKKIAEEKEG